jgi:4-diphosphocytidyl-2-C-methyl-D-erythritol kinase
MLSFPTAKINLGLNILNRRTDGYHNLESVFYPVGWADALEVIPADSTLFTSSGMAIPADGKDNLCLRAYQRLVKDFEISPIQIHLHKAIPIGAGLGGGSADGAFTLKLLNHLFNLGLSEVQLQTYARTLGSDCAFFIENKPVFCVDKGDIFQPTSVSLAGKWIVLVYPNLHISTAEAYSGIVPQIPEIDLQTALRLPAKDWKAVVKNDFETFLFPKYPVLAEVKQQLYDLGAFYASMTGSGSTLFGLFDQETNLKKAFPTEYQVWEGRLY